MESNIGLTFETLQNYPGFLLTTPANDIVEVVFTEAPENYFVGQTPESLNLMSANDIMTTIYNSDGDIALYLHKESEGNQSFTFTINNILTLELKNNKLLILNLKNGTIHLKLKDCIISNVNNNNITITINESNAECVFTTNSVVNVMVAKNIMMQSVEDNKLFIASSKRIPEFIISIYDDENWQRPRPSRFGVPVISTVPGFIPDDSWEITIPIADLDMMELGVGTEVRKMYFRIISDQLIDASIRDNLSLSIDLPAGVDTVSDTVSIPLIYDSSNDTNEIFSCDYVFHKENTVDFVDGFAYLSVKMPLRIQRNLPLLFQISNTGAIFDDPPDDADLDSDSVEPLSMESNIVQPIQGLTSKKMKTKKSGKKQKDS